MTEDLWQEAANEARTKGHLLGGWTPHRLGWGGRCLFCNIFILVAEGNRVYGLAGPDCWNR
ncbi:MAG: hypothetical protein WCG94_02420 [Methanothrix sp.]|jgi:hypothetical protein